MLRTRTLQLLAFVLTSLCVGCTPGETMLASPGSPSIPGATQLPNAPPVQQSSDDSYYTNDQPVASSSEDSQENIVKCNNTDFYGEFTIVSYCWKGRNMQESIGDDPDMIDPASCIGYPVKFAPDLCKTNDIELKNPQYQCYSVPEKGSNYERIYGLVFLLANELDLSKAYEERWKNIDPVYEIDLPYEQFPKMTWDSDMRKSTIFILQRAVILDENHLLLGLGIWNLLAVRNSHLEAGCNYAEYSDSVFGSSILTK